MTSHFIVGGCVVSFVFVLTLIFVFTEPSDDIGTSNLILGSNGESDVLILTSKSASVLPPEVNDITDLWGLTPVEFLKTLKMERSATEDYVFREPIKNWISKSDLPGLLALSKSREPCAAVVLATASTGPSHGSTLGREALFMIDGCRKGAYPPALNSGLYDEAAAKELTDWCRNEIRAPGK